VHGNQKMEPVRYKGGAHQQVEERGGDGKTAGGTKKKTRTAGTNCPVKRETSGKFFSGPREGGGYVWKRRGRGTKTQKGLGLNKREIKKGETETGKTGETGPLLGGFGRKNIQE